jgi:hypothetical protein
MTSGAPRPAACEELKARTAHSGCHWMAEHSTVEPGYNDIDLYDTSCIASDILWY